MAKVTMPGDEPEETVDAPEEEPLTRDDLPEENYDPTTLEELDPNELLWEGGPTAGDAQVWKKEFGRLYATEITFDYHVLWRTLKRAEYKNIIRSVEKLTATGQMTQAEANLYNEEVIAETCILFPPFSRANLTEELAGVPSLISQQVMEASGFVSGDVRGL